MLVPTCELEPGLVVGSDVRSRQGQLLVAAGAALTPRQIGILRTWGIPGVHITDPAEVARNARPVTRDEVVAAERLERQRFSACDLDQPVVKALWLLALKRRIQRSRA